jgi:hypothetical protein
MGPVVIFLGCALLWYNEGVAIKTHRLLNEAQSAVVHLPSAIDINPDHDNKLVHLSHMLSVDSSATDDIFGLTPKAAISLHRKVEIYQWVEHHRKEERKLGNGEIEVRDHYTYSKEWREGINNQQFEEPRGHTNPTSSPYDSATFSGSGIRLGDFTLGSELLNQVSWSSSVPIRGKVQVPSGGEIVGNSIYFQGLAEGGEDDYGRRNDDYGRRNDDYGHRVEHQQNKQQKWANPEDSVDSKIVKLDGQDRIMYTVKQTGEQFSRKEQALEAARQALAAARQAPARRLLRSGGARIGDIRVSFTEVACRTVSVLAKQSATELIPWQGNQGSGYTVAVVVSGQESAESMIDAEQSSNNIWTWVKRLVGWLLCLVGFGMLTSIITATADITLNWIPFLGPMATTIIEWSVSIANFVLATFLSIVVAAVAWIFYRPVLGVTLLAIACGLMYLTSKAGEQNKAKKAQA